MHHPFSITSTVDGIAISVMPASLNVFLSITLSSVSSVNSIVSRSLYEKALRHICLTCDGILMRVKDVAENPFDLMISSFDLLANSTFSKLAQSEKAKSPMTFMKEGILTLSMSRCANMIVSKMSLFGSLFPMKKSSP